MKSPLENYLRDIELENEMKGFAEMVKAERPRIKKSPSKLKTVLVGAVTLGLSVALGGCFTKDSLPSQEQPYISSTEPEPTEDYGPWPDLDKATIRPGVRTYGEKQCTSNFLFGSWDNSTLYLGSAAQCVGKVGDRVEIEGTDGAKFAGEVAYTTRNGARAGDFALVKLDNSYRSAVHPAVIELGGPTELFMDHLYNGDQVGFYGDSELTEGEDQLNFHNCLMTPHQFSEEWFKFHCLPPGVDGDYGAGVLTPDAQAAGILVGNMVDPYFSNNATYLKHELDGVSSAGVHIRLMTWPRLVNV